MAPTEDLYACVIVPLYGKLAEVIRSVRAASVPEGCEIPPHITVLPPFRCAEPLLVELADRLTTALHGQPSFRVGNGAVGSFEPISPVVYLNIQQGYEDILQLHHTLRNAVPEAQFRFPFLPHITIAHSSEPNLLRAAGQEIAGFNGISPVTEVQLVAGTTLAHWWEVKSIPLDNPVS